MTTALRESSLPLPLVRRGKVREVYDAGPEALLLVAEVALYRAKGSGRNRGVMSGGETAGVATAGTQAISDRR